jgi:hypothetical protein
MADEIQKVSWDTSRANAELGAPRELVLNQNLTEGPELITQDNAGLDAFHFPSEEKLILSDSSELIGFNDTGLTYISGSTIKDAIDSIDQAMIDFLAGAFSFLGLTDTPSAYTGQAGKVVKVNATGDGLEFGTGGGGGGTAFDEVLTTYTSGNITTEVFKLAGSTVKTVTRTYDSSNRPATISDGTNTWTFEYNSTGLQTRRVKT